MIKLIIISASACFILICCSCESLLNQTKSNDRFTGDGFYWVLKDEIKIEKSTSVDFIVYDFLYDDKVILGAYVGNHPDFPSLEVPEDKEIRNIKINCLNTQIISWQDDKGSENQEVLIEFSQYRSWPAYIHFWYYQLPPRFSTISDSIIFSTHSVPVKNPYALHQLLTGARREFLEEFFLGDMNQTMKHFSEFLRILEDEYKVQKKAGEIHGDYRVLNYSLLSKVYKDELLNMETFLDIPIVIEIINPNQDGGSVLFNNGSVKSITMVEYNQLLDKLQIRLK